MRVAKIHINGVELYFVSEQDAELLIQCAPPGTISQTLVFYESRRERHIHIPPEARTPEVEALLTLIAMGGEE